jgi:hypothetical protein
MLFKLHVVEFWCWEFTVKAGGFFLILFLSIVYIYVYKLCLLLSDFFSCVCHLVIFAGKESFLQQCIGRMNFRLRTLKCIKDLPLYGRCEVVKIYICIYISPRHDTPPNSSAQAVTLVCINSWLVHLMYCVRIFMSLL